MNILKLIFLKDLLFLLIYSIIQLTAITLFPFSIAKLLELAINVKHRQYTFKLYKIITFKKPFGFL